MNFMNEIQHQLKQFMAAITSNALFRFIYEIVVRNIKPLNIIMEKKIISKSIIIDNLWGNPFNQISLVWFQTESAVLWTVFSQRIQAPRILNFSNVDERDHILWRFNNYKGKKRKPFFFYLEHKFNRLNDEIFIIVGTLFGFKSTK